MNTKTMICGLALGALALGAAVESTGQPVTSETVAAKEKAQAKDKSLLDFYLAGGLWMHPIALCSIAAVGFAALCLLQVNKNRIMPPALSAALTNHMSLRQVTEAFHLCRGQPNPLAAVMGAALVKANFEREMYNKPAMESAAAETLAQEESRMMLVVNGLNICAQIAPMLGLLGTVVGMIESFDALAAGKSEPSDLAGGIGVAMLTTAFGLIVAIPSMAAYFYFRTSLAGIMADLQKSAVNMLDLFTGEISADGMRAPTGYTGRIPAQTQAG